MNDVIVANLIPELLMILLQDNDPLWIVTVLRICLTVISVCGCVFAINYVAKTIFRTWFRS